MSGTVHLLPVDDQAEKKGANYKQYIAEARIDRLTLMQGDVDGKGFGGKKSACMRDAPAGLNQAGDAGIGGAHHGTTALHGAQHDLRPMLVRCGRSAEPGVVGGIDEEIGIVLHQRPGNFWKNRLVTNKHAERDIAVR